MIIAIDGPTASGKGTVAAAVAQEVASQGIPAKELPAAQVASASKTLTPEQFNQLKHSERNEFIRSGGKILTSVEPS